MDGGALEVAGLTLPFTTLAVIVAQVFVASPFYIRAARAGFRAVEPEVEEAPQPPGVVDKSPRGQQPAATPPDQEPETEFRLSGLEQEPATWRSALLPALLTVAAVLILAQPQLRLADRYPAQFDLAREKAQAFLDENLPRLAQSVARQLGHVPLMNRSGRKRPHSSQ